MVNNVLLHAVRHYNLRFTPSPPDTQTLWMDHSCWSDRPVGAPLAAHAAPLPRTLRHWVNITVMNGFKLLPLISSLTHFHREEFTLSKENTKVMHMTKQVGDWGVEAAGGSNLSADSIALWDSLRGQVDRKLGRGLLDQHSVPPK